MNVEQKMKVVELAQSRALEHFFSDTAGYTWEVIIDLLQSHDIEGGGGCFGLGVIRRLRM